MQMNIEWRKILNIRRREISEYYDRFPESSLKRSIANLLTKAILQIFIQRLKSMHLGSEEWHNLQDKLSNGSSVGIEEKKRIIFYSHTLPACGQNLYVHPGVIMYYPHNIQLGNNVAFNRGVFLTARDKIEIGNDVMIGPYTVINSGNHVYLDPTTPIRNQGHIKAPIIIGEDVWIGANVTILAGVTIGQGAVIAAGAVVVRSVAAYTVVGGVPARIIKHRK